MQGAWPHRAAERDVAALPVYLSLYLSIYLSLSIYIYIDIYLSIYPSAFAWGFYYDFTNFYFKKNNLETLNIYLAIGMKSKFCFRIQVLFNKQQIGEIIVKSPYQLCLRLRPSLAPLLSFSHRFCRSLQPSCSKVDPESDQVRFGRGRCNPR